MPSEGSAVLCTTGEYASDDDASSVPSVQSVGDLKALREREKQFKFVFKFVWIINQRELRREFRRVFARAALVQPSGMRLCQKGKQFKFLFKFVLTIMINV